MRASRIGVPLPATAALVVSLMVAACAGEAVTVGEPSDGSAGATDANLVPAPRKLPRPNIVLILTDDQRIPSLKAMPNVRRLLVDRGITFTRAYVSDPLCCPSRTSILTGNYSHTTGIYRNAGRFGGASAFRRSGDRSTLATWLDPRYRTALIGKYLNDFAGPAHAGYVPPGWDLFEAFAQKTGHYYDYELTVNGQIEARGSQPSDYSTTVFTEAAEAFIRDTRRPFLLYFAPFGPHRAAIPAPGDEDAFSGIAAWRPPSFDETNVSDKPRWLQRQPSLSAAERGEVQEFRLDQLRTLRSIDLAVARIVAALRETGQLHDTVIVYTSDNGVHWGEHRMTGKSSAYEESIHVPLVVRYDRLIPRPRRDGHLIVNVDLAPTIGALARVRTPATDGMSFLSVLEGDPGPWRSGFLLEHMRTRNLSPAPSFCGWHTRRYVFLDYASGRDELYDLRIDPYQNHNAADRAAMKGVLDRLETRLRAECDPRPPRW